jgi:hypothetical protein
MNRHSDSVIPALVTLGADAHIVFTLPVTWWIQPRYPKVYVPLLWIALVLSLNFLPVVLLRLTLTADIVYASQGEDEFRSR